MQTTALFLFWKDIAVFFIQQIINHTQLTAKIPWNVFIYFVKAISINIYPPSPHQHVSFLAYINRTMITVSYKYQYLRSVF